MQFTLFKTANNEYQSSTRKGFNPTLQIQNKMFCSQASSVHLNMLSMSKMTISRQQLKLIEIIGQGISHTHTHE